MEKRLDFAFSRAFKVSKKSSRETTKYLKLNPLKKGKGGRGGGSERYEEKR